MVHDEIQADVNATFVAGGSQICKIIHGSEFFLDFTEISNRITAVTASLWGVKKRHQMQIINIAFLNIIQFGFQIGKSTGKCIDIHHHTGKIIALVPCRIFFTFQIRFFQCIATHVVELLEYFQKIVQVHRDIWIVLIQFTVEPFQFVEMAGKTLAVDAVVVAFVFKSDRFGFCSFDFDSLGFPGFHLNRLSLFCLDFDSFSLLGFNFNRFGLFCLDFSSFGFLSLNFNRLSLFCLDFDSFSLLGFNFNRFGLFCLDFDSISFPGFYLNRFGLFRFHL